MADVFDDISLESEEIEAILEAVSIAAQESRVTPAMERVDSYLREVIEMPRRKFTRADRAAR